MQLIKRSWEDLPARTASLSYELLSRYSTLGVDPYTEYVGQVVCEQFPLSTQGNRNVARFMNNLLIWTFFNRSIEFGYGSRHIAREYVEPRFTLFAICGVLLEYYNESITVAVFNCLVQNLETPHEIAPSLRQ